MTTSPTRGIRGFELDMHVAFVQPLTEAQAQAKLQAFEQRGLHLELYRPHPRSMPAGGPAGGGIPSARLTGPWPDLALLHELLAALLSADVKYAELGLRGFLRSATGQTEWMPWRKNVVLPRQDSSSVALVEGVKYILE